MDDRTKADIKSAIQECLWTTCSGIGETLPLSMSVQRHLRYSVSLYEVQDILNESYSDLESMLH